MIDRSHGGTCPQKNIIDFSVNINPLGLPKGVADRISDYRDCVLRYPDPSSERLKRRLAARHAVSPENVVIGNGSIELIHLIPRALKIKKALIAVPSFSEYEYAFKVNGSTVSFFKTSELEEFRLDIDAISARIPRRGYLVICNPNNPTGSLLSADEVMRLVRVCRKRDTVLISDEAFIDFTDAYRAEGVIAEAIHGRSLVILRSLTKIFAMPGLRLGYAIAHKEAIGKMTQHQYPWNVNGLAQRIGEMVLDDERYMRLTRTFIAEERRFVTGGLRAINGLKVYPPSANFVLCKLHSSTLHDSKELARRMSRDGICIRTCGNFRGLDERFFRVAIRNRRDNERLLNALGRAVR